MDTAAIAAASVDMKTCQLQQQAGISVMRMSMDNAQQSAQAITDMIKVNTQVSESAAAERPQQITKEQQEKS